MRRLLLTGAATGIMCFAPAAHAAKALMPPPPRSSSADDEVKWATANLDLDGWTQLGIGDNVIRYMAPSGIERQSGRDLRIWVRQEYFTPEMDNALPVRSALILTEYDCDQQRFRQMALDLYPYNNLQGAKRSEDLQAPQWAFPRPLTVAAYEIGTICKLVDEADAEAAQRAAKAQAMPQGDATYRSVTPLK